MAGQQRWGIVGGGMLGMTLAHRLAQQGASVTLCEGANEVGGLASAWQLGDVVWDRHYHVIAPGDAALLGLLAELGLENEVRWSAARTGFYTDGTCYSMSTALEFVRFPALGWTDKLRLGLTILYASRIRNWRPLEAISVTDWLCRWSGRRTFEKIWLPLLRAKLGENYRHASAAFIWAIIARLYAARRGGAKREAFGYVRGGYANILARFAAMLAGNGVVIRLGCRATQVVRTDDGVRVDFQDGSHAVFDQVVLTVAAPLAARVCPALSADEQARLRQIRYQGIICASLLMRQPLGAFYVTNITDDWVPFTGVIEMSNLVDRAQLGGQSLVYLPKYLVPDDPAFALSDADIETTFVAALERMYPQFDRHNLLSFRISRVPYVMAVATLHYSDRLPPMTTSVRGLHIVNSAHIINGTLNVNETVQLADAAARELGLGV